MCVLCCPQFSAGVMAGWIFWLIVAVATVNCSSNGWRLVDYHFSGYKENEQGKLSFHSYETHNRMKRATSPGLGIPNAYTFTMETTSPATFKLGEVRQYKITIQGSIEATQVLIELFSEVSGGAYFKLTNARITQVGSNYGTFDPTSVQVTYESTFDDGRWDYARIPIGTLLNQQQNVADPAASEIVIEFEAQSLYHSKLVDQSTYKISAGALYGAKRYISIAQDSPAYSSYVAPSTLVDSSYVFEGPSTIAINTTEVFKLTAYIHMPVVSITIEALAPIIKPGVMTVDKIRITSVGDNWKPFIELDGMGNLTVFQPENVGGYASFKLGVAINDGYLMADPNSDAEANHISFELPITVLNHEPNDTNPYILGFAVWTENVVDGGSKLSTGHTNITVADISPLLLGQNSISSCSVTTSSVEVVSLGRFAVLFNMTIEPNTTDEYLITISVGDGSSELNIERVRISYAGYNLPHLDSYPPSSSSAVYDSTNGVTNDRVTWDLGYITHIGQKSGSEDSTIQAEILVQLSSASGGDPPIDAIVTSTGGSSCSDTASIKLDPGLTIPADKVPLFDWTSLMGYEAPVSTLSALAYDLDIIAPAGVEYRDPTECFVKVDTQYNITDNKARLKILDMSVVHSGLAVVYETFGSDAVSYGSFPLDTDLGSVAYSTAEMKFQHLTSLKIEDFARYYERDSTIRIRVLVGFIGDADAIPANDTVFRVQVHAQLHTTVFNSYHEAIFIDPSPDFYTGQDWQPLSEASVTSGYSTSVVPGGATKFSVLLSVPYRSYADIKISVKGSTDVQLCNMEPADDIGSSIAPYPPASQGAAFTTDPATGVRTAANVTFSVVTSIGDEYEVYYDKYLSDTYIQYTVVVLLSQTTTVNTDYPIEIITKVGSVIETHSLTISTIAPSIGSGGVNQALVVSMYHQKATNTINLIGSEWIYFDIYIPPGSADSYNLTIYNNDGVAMQGLYVGSVGANLGCFNYGEAQEAVFVGDSYAAINFGSMINTGILDTPIEVTNNLARVLALVKTDGLIKNVGDAIVFHAELVVGGTDLFTYSMNLTVIDEDDPRNEQPGDIAVTSQLPNTKVSIGELVPEVLTVMVEPGFAASRLKLIVEYPLAPDGETSVNIPSPPSVSKLPLNLEVAETQYEVNILNSNNGLPYGYELDFHFFRSSNLSSLSNFITNNSTSTTDEFNVTHSIRILDAIHFHDGFVISPKIRMEFSSPTEVVNITANRLLTISDDPTVLPDVSYTFGVVPSSGVDITAGSEMIVAASLKLNSGSFKEPEDVKVIFNLPPFCEYNDGSYVGDELSSPVNVMDSHLVLTWDKLRYQDSKTFTFNITVDPKSILPPEFDQKTFNILSEVMYSRTNRSNTNSKTEYTLSVLASESLRIIIPANEDSLGMAENVISDCQITASTGASTNARLNSNGGWLTEARGPPFYQNEYIQIDMGILVKFTGVTIQPHQQYLQQRILSLKLYFSTEGHVWYPVRDDSLTVKDFEIVWSANPTTEETQFISLGSMSFIGKMIRILPQTAADNLYVMGLRFELHGYTVDGNPLPTYSCPATDASLMPYHERQALLVTGNELIYVCMSKGPGQIPQCSMNAANDKPWYKISSSVINILGFRAGNLYGLSKNRKLIMKSTDLGLSWGIVDVEEYNQEKMEVDYQAALEVPFGYGGPLAATPDAYFTYLGGQPQTPNVIKSLSLNGIHRYLVGDAISETVGLISYWGSNNWPAR